MSDEVVFDEWMNDSDAIMWHIERDPLLRSTITSVWTLDCEPDPTRFEATLDRALVAIPRLRQRVVADRIGVSTPRWEVDPDFDPDRHLIEHTIGDDDLLVMAAGLAAAGFDRNRPLWEMHLVHGLDGGRAAVVMKIHHSVADGMGMVRMTECLIEPSREPTDGIDPPAPPPDPPAPRGGWDRWWSAVAHRARSDADIAGRYTRAAAGRLAHFATHPWEEMQEWAGTAGSVGRMVMPASAPLSPLLTGRSAQTDFGLLSLEFGPLREVSRSRGVTLNDTFVAGVLGGLARYHEHHGCAPERLRMNMPINVRARGEKTTAGNQFVPARFEVPLDVADPARRVAVLHDTLADTRAEPALPLLDDISAAINRTGVAATTRLLGGMLKSVDITTSNVPGPPFPVYAAGARIEHMHPFGPLAGAAVNVTLFSYDGSLDIGVNSDRAAVPDPQVLLRLMAEGFDEVLALG